MSYTPITQVIALLPPAPNSLTDTPSVFNTKANEWVSKLETPYTPSLNTLSTQMNVLAEEINQTVATLPSGVINDTTPSDTNTYSSNKIDTLTGNNPSSGWDGNSLTEQQLTDFYGVGSVTIVGAFASAKSYPDGSIVGSTDNGHFELRANGSLYVHKIDSSVGITTSTASGQIFSSTDTTFNFPIHFVSAPKVNPVPRNISGRVWATTREAPTTTSIRLRILGSANTDSGYHSYEATGRWK